MCRSQASREGSSHIALSCELTVTSGLSRARSEPQFPLLDIRESDTAPFWDVRLNRTLPVLDTRHVRIPVSVAVCLSAPAPGFPWHSCALGAAPRLSPCPHSRIPHPRGG